MSISASEINRILRVDYEQAYDAALRRSVYGTTDGTVAGDYPAPLALVREMAAQERAAHPWRSRWERLVVRRWREIARRVRGAWRHLTIGWCE